MTTSETHRTIDAVWRIESAKLIAALARMVRDIGLAEDLAQDALVAALEQWPTSVVPDNPGAWLNRAVALAMAFGPAAGLEVVDTLTSELSLEGYHLLPSVRGDFLAKLGRFDEARAEFARAASLTRNARERTLLLERAARCARGP